MDRSTIDRNYILEGFHKIDGDLQELMSCFREVLEELGQKSIAARLPWISSSDTEVAGECAESSLGLEQAYSVAFQILNIVESNAAARTRRLREIDSGLTVERGLWGEQLLELKKLGYQEEEIAAFLSEVRVEPVFTAHPTEAKRGAVLEQHRILHQLLASADQMELTPSEKRDHRRRVKLCLEKLWRSGEIFLEQPSIADERREILFYFREILPTAVLSLDERLRNAWEEVGFSPVLLEERGVMPQLQFGTWVGGDRDGHPLVNAAVTQESLLELRHGALALLYRSLDQLSHALPLSRHFQQPSQKLLQLIKELSQELGALGAEIATLYRDEPWRQAVLLIQAKLPKRESENLLKTMELSGAVFKSVDEVRHALQVVAQSLEDIGANHLVQSTLRPLFRQLDLFGFHLATLDIRQNSDFHDRALQQILEVAGVADAATFPDWSEERRLSWLRQELTSPKQLLSDHTQLGLEARALLECYLTLQRHAEAFGWSGIGSLIVSMTRSLSDLLTVVFLGREGGMARWNGTTVYLPIATVPLFESRHDLSNAATLLEAYLQEPSTLATLDKIGKSVQIMIGYSDSNKDCGIIASQWELYQAQQAMTNVAKKQDLKLQFFHGRGGTISRGAGPTHLFLASLPQGSLQGSIRMTEQGETIAQKYSSASTATYHLELLLAGVTRTSLLHQHQKKSTSLLAINHDASTEATLSCTAAVDFSEESIATFLAQESAHAYRKLIDAEGFIDFYQQATPLDALEASRIGSRPKRRSQSRSLNDLRAIPWVFSWNQSRYFLPGWFGVGSALLALEEKQPALFELLREGHRDFPFLNYVLSNVETNLASAHLAIMEQYTTLVTDAAIRNRIFSLIDEEFQQTERQLQKIFGGSFEKRRPRMAKTLALRAKALKFLHEHQIAILREWRHARQTDPVRAEQLLTKVLLSINAIASGLRTTG
jgi:phosphoenolpyruvate carboxylase